jgi:RHS repeat-associated protein
VNFFGVREDTALAPVRLLRARQFRIIPGGAIQDRIGCTWTYDHDTNRRLTSTTDPSNHQTLYAYNPIDELTTLTDANSHVTQWAYDVEGRLTTKTYADMSTLAFTYETTTSRLKSTTDALNQVRQLTYAQDDRVTGISYVGPLHPTPNVTFAYDPYFPRRTSMADGSGTTTYAYVPVGALGALQVQQETRPPANIAYAYDALGRLSSRTVGGQGTETYGYDAIGRLTSHAGDLGSFTLAWLGQSGQIASRSLAGSLLESSWAHVTYTNDRRLASVGTTGLTTGQSTSFAYTTNAVNETTDLTQTSDAAIAYPSGSLTQTASYNTLNQLTNLTGQAFTFDANGNLTGDGQRTYQWDAENRLIAIGYPSQAGKATTVAYDGLGRRVQISSTPTGGGSATVTSYLWCGQALCQARNSADVVTRGYYTEGEFTPGAPATSYYYAPDRVGSVRRVFTAASAPGYDYDAYGNPLQATAPVTDYGYAGMVTNPDSGLYLTTYRPYDPATGRFLLRDPIGEAGDPLGNLYAYVGGDPVSTSDPWGLQIVPPAGIPPPPADLPGGPYTWIPDPSNPRGGMFYGPKQPSGPRSMCTYTRTGEVNNNKNPYWKTKLPGQEGWSRFDPNGQPITEEQAHGGNPELTQAGEAAQVIRWGAQFGPIGAGIATVFVAVFWPSPAY